MNVQIFVFLLSIYSVLTALVVEAVKKIVEDKKNLPYNIIALTTALIIGVVGTVAYYQLVGIPYTVNNIIYAIMLGFASGLSSMVGFDKMKQLVEQIVG